MRRRERRREREREEEAILPPRARFSLSPRRTRSRVGWLGRAARKASNKNCEVGGERGSYERLSPSRGIFRLPMVLKVKLPRWDEKCWRGCVYPEHDIAKPEQMQLGSQRSSHISSNTSHPVLLEKNPSSIPKCRSPTVPHGTSRANNVGGLFFFPLARSGLMLDVSWP